MKHKDSLNLFYYLPSSSAPKIYIYPKAIMRAFSILTRKQEPATEDKIAIEMSEIIGIMEGNNMHISVLTKV